MTHSKTNNNEVYTDGKLELNKGYAIVSVIYHSMGDRYVPYIVGVVIEGPKGGKYLIDNFGIMYLFRYFNIQAKQGIDCRLLDKDGIVKVTSKRLVLNKDLVAGKTNEECSSKYAKTHGYKYIKRSDVLSFIDKIK